MAPRTRKPAAELSAAIPAVAATFEKTDSLKPWPGNPRWNESAIGPVSDSIARFGFGSPIVARLADRTVIAGHTRLEAAKRLGLSVVPVRFLDISETEAAALAVADNKLGEIAEWDQDALAKVLGELNAAGTEIRSLGFDDDELDALLAHSLGQGPGGGGDKGPSDDEKRATARRSLDERFGLGPFSVLDARKGWWIERKRAWIALGIRSEIGRGEALLRPGPALPGQDVAGNYGRAKQKPGTYSRGKAGQSFGQDMISRKGKPAEHKVSSGEHKDPSDPRLVDSGGVTFQSMAVADPRFYAKKRAAEAELGRTLSLDEFRAGHYTPPKPGEESASGSIFDPVLTELLVRWFSPRGGLVLDPFAGGSVRGVVAVSLGRAYHGVELRAEQVAANVAQAAQIFPGAKAKRPAWKVGDSAKAKLPKGVDFVLTCPPYGDLEVYSDDPADISNMPWEQFAAAYRKILGRAFAALSPDRFAAVVVGDIRDGKGLYRGLPELTVAAAAEAGLAKYNDAILVTSLGSLPVRVGLSFGGARKLGKTHQNVLVFVKGDWRKAHAALGSVEGEFGDVGAETPEETPPELAREEPPADEPPTPG